VLLTAILTATKFSDDFPLGVEVFARLGGIATKDMGKMEMAFCSLIGFDFNVNPAEFEAKCMKNLSLAFDIASQRVGAGKRQTPSPRQRAPNAPGPVQPAGSPVQLASARAVSQRSAKATAPMRLAAVPPASMHVAGGVGGSAPAAVGGGAATTTASAAAGSIT
jgi:hypothetical protein